MSASKGAHDVTVVGAGAAGCVAAARLSEDPSCRVLRPAGKPLKPRGFDISIPGRRRS